MLVAAAAITIVLLAVGYTYFVAMLASIYNQLAGSAPGRTNE